jgi:isoquinoline 1-oxidoreductase subunit beta
MDGNILTRRQFVVTGLTAAGGLAIGLAHPGIAHALAIKAQPWGEDASDAREFNAWLVIEPDDTIIVRYGRAEMGQGTFTSLTMCVAEELQCDWSKVKSEFASAHRNVTENNVYGDQSSVGSHSVRLGREKAQQIGASARERLIAAAAQQWKVEPASCVAESSKVIHKASGRTLRFGQLASEAAKITLAQEPAIKTPEQYTFMGKPQHRLDVPLKINGTAKFGIDIRIPGMVYAAINACPVFGGTVKSVDLGNVKSRRGIIDVVQLQDAVAVVGDRYWRAKEALAALKIEWDTGAAGTTTSAQFAKDYRDALDGPAANAENIGDADAVIAGAAKTVEAVYEVPYLAHARMEPSNATVHLQGDRLDLWMGTQDATGTLKQAARVANMPPEQIYVHNCFSGGGFGGRGSGKEVNQAIAIAKAVNKPVKLVWTREEDVRQDRYRPQAAIRFKAGLSADGTPVGWNIRTVVGSLLRSAGVNKVESGVEPMAVEGLKDTPYNLPNKRVDCVLKNTHVPVFFWRSVGASQNAFAIQSFVDEMAHAASKDPYQFRRALLEGKPDWLGVLDLVAEKGDWGKPLPAGHGRGIAIHECYGSIVGEVAEVSISPKGDVKVERVTIAVDCGHAVNPLTVAEQMEGGMIFGLSAALHGDITIKNGAVEQGNFNDYKVVRLADAPPTKVYFALSGGSKWGGCGEPGTAPIAAAVANAVFAITGKRIRSLPIRPQDLISGA